MYVKVLSGAGTKYVGPPVKDTIESNDLFVHDVQADPRQNRCRS